MKSENDVNTAPLLKTHTLTPFLCSHLSREPEEPLFFWVGGLLGGR